MLLTREELDGLAVMDASISDFLSKNPRPDVELTDYMATRAGLKKTEEVFNAQAIEPVAVAGEFYHTIPMRDSFMSTLKVHRQTNAPPGPLIVLVFGGGFIAGTVDQLTRPARALVKLFGATVVCISYRISPEFKFPTAQYDAWDSMKWIAENATSPILNSDPSKHFIMGGISAGAALTASMSRLFQEQPLTHPLTGQWLSVPSVMDHTCIPQGYEKYYVAALDQTDGPFLSRKARELFKMWAEWDSASPLRYAVNSKTPLSGQPPTYFQVDGIDPLRDDALIYDEMLKEAGVATKIDIYPGCPHGHFLSFAGLEVTDRANTDIIVGIGWLLAKEISRSAAAEAFGL